MRNVRIARILGFIWEILRFGFVSLTLIYYINPSPDLTISFYVILVGSAQLLIPAGLILMVFRPERYQHLTKLLALGKALAVVAVIAVLVTQSGLFALVIQAIGTAAESGTKAIAKELPIFVVYGLAMTGLVDLVMVLFLMHSGDAADG